MVTKRPESVWPFGDVVRGRIAVTLVVGHPHREGAVTVDRALEVVGEVGVRLRAQAERVLGQVDDRPIQAVQSARRSHGSVEPNCGVRTTLPVSALIAIDMPPLGDAIHSSPVKYQGMPSIMSIVDEQKYS